MNYSNYIIENLETISLDGYKLSISLTKSSNPKKEVIFLAIEDELGAYTFKDLISKYNDEGYDIYISSNQKYVAVDSFIKYFKKNLKERQYIVISFGKGDVLANIFATRFASKVSRRVVIAPSEIVKGYTYPTLIMWSDLDHKYKNQNKAIKLFLKNKNNLKVKFICYPNYSHSIHLGKEGSYYYEEAKTSLKDIDIQRHKLSLLDKEFLSDLDLFIKQNEVKEKIAIVSENHLPFLNGVNILSDLLKKEWEKKGIKVYVITLKLKEHDYVHADESNIKTIKGILPPGKTAKVQALYTSFNIGGNAKIVRAMQLDSIHLQNEYSLSKVMMRVSKKDKIPMVYTNHTLWDVMFKTKFRGISPIVIYLSNLILFKPAAKFAHIMTVPTEKVVKVWAKKGKTKNIVALPSAIDLDKYKLSEDDKKEIELLRKQYNVENDFVLGFVGRISYEKDIHEIIDFVSRLKEEVPNLKYMIVGNGEALDYLKKYAKKKEVEDRIIFVGEIKNDKVKLFYGLFDAFSTASTFETQGLTYVEAMTAGCPLLVRDDECLDNFVENRINGLKYTCFEEFKEYLFDLMQSDELRHNIYENSRKTLLNFRKDIWADKIYLLHKEARKVLLDPNYVVDFDKILKR